MLNNEETTNPKVPINCEVELTSLQSPRGFNGLSLNDKIEGGKASKVQAKNNFSLMYNVSNLIMLLWASLIRTL